MRRQRIPGLKDIKRTDLSAMSRAELEELTWDLHELARTLANRAGEDSTTSSRPPSSDNPYRRDAKSQQNSDRSDRDDDGGGGGSAPGGNASGGNPGPKPAGKRPGTKGFWRRLPIMVSGEVLHAPKACDTCNAVFGSTVAQSRHVSAHLSFELTRGDMNLHVAATKHSYLAIRCDCGHETIARPASGLCSHVEGRRRDLQMSERCLVGPMLATFIAALSLRFRLSRVKIAEFLVDWLGVELGVATIERCIHEFGLASEPVVEQLIEEVRAAEIVHLDETPWYQKATLLWLWVAVTATTIVYRIGSRKHCELAALVGDAFLGWLVTDGYGAYRDHPRRQRCLAHLIRKARALAVGHYGAGSGFGRDLVRDLRRLIERVHDGDDPAAIKRLIAGIKWNGSYCAGCWHPTFRGRVLEMALNTPSSKGSLPGGRGDFSRNRAAWGHSGVGQTLWAPASNSLRNMSQWNCQCNRHEVDTKVRGLAGEILNDWDAVIAFVADPDLPPTNNDAERALRHAVISRRISFGTRSDEGSRFYAAALSVIDTCRKRRTDPWAYAYALITAARSNNLLPTIPAQLAI